MRAWNIQITTPEGSEFEVNLDAALTSIIPVSQDRARWIADELIRPLEHLIERDQRTRASALRESLVGRMGQS